MSLMGDQFDVNEKRVATFGTDQLSGDTSQQGLALQQQQLRAKIKSKMKKKMKKRVTTRITIVENSSSPRDTTPKLSTTSPSSSDDQSCTPSTTSTFFSSPPSSPIISPSLPFSTSYTNKSSEDSREGEKGEAMLGPSRWSAFTSKRQTERSEAGDGVGVGTIFDVVASADGFEVDINSGGDKSGGTDTDTITEGDYQYNNDISPTVSSLEGSSGSSVISSSISDAVDTLTFLTKDLLKARSPIEEADNEDEEEPGPNEGGDDNDDGGGSVFFPSSQKGETVQTDQQSPKWNWAKSMFSSPLSSPSRSVAPSLAEYVSTSGSSSVEVTPSKDVTSLRSTSNQDEKIDGSISEKENDMHVSSKTIIMSTTTTVTKTVTEPRNGMESCGRDSGAIDVILEPVRTAQHAVEGICSNTVRDSDVNRYNTHRSFSIDESDYSEVDPGTPTTASTSSRSSFESSTPSSATQSSESRMTERKTDVPPHPSPNSAKEYRTHLTLASRMTPPITERDREPAVARMRREAAKETSLIPFDENRIVADPTAHEEADKYEVDPEKFMHDRRRKWKKNLMIAARHEKERMHLNNKDQYPHDEQNEDESRSPSHSKSKSSRHSRTNGGQRKSLERRRESSSSSSSSSSSYSSFSSLSSPGRKARALKKKRRNGGGTSRPERDLDALPRSSVDMLREVLSKTCFLEDEICSFDEEEEDFYFEEFSQASIGTNESAVIHDLRTSPVPGDSRNTRKKTRRGRTSPEKGMIYTNSSIELVMKHMPADGDVYSKDKLSKDLKTTSEKMENSIKKKSKKKKKSVIDGHEDTESRLVAPIGGKSDTNVPKEMDSSISKKLKNQGVGQTDRTIPRTPETKNRKESHFTNQEFDTFFKEISTKGIMLKCSRIYDGLYTLPPTAVRMFFLSANNGGTSTDSMPRPCLLWRHQHESGFKEEDVAAFTVAETSECVGLFDIFSVEKADASTLQHYPFARLPKSFSITLIDKIKFFFETENELEQRWVVEGLKRIISNCAHDLITSNWQSSAFSLRGEVPVFDEDELFFKKSLDNVTDILIDTSLRRLKAS